MEALISKTLVDSSIRHDEFVLVNILKEYNNMKKANKNHTSI